MSIRPALLTFCILSLFFIGWAQERTLKRSESFYGFHFDFHATSKDKEIGKTLTSGMIDSLLTMTHPDFIQVDCKGHPGCSSYPTKVGNQAGGYTQDILKLFREVTQRHHVALYVHYSGVWDQKAIEKHPWWGIVRPDGKRDSLKTSFYSAYLDSLMIPQLKELSSSYHIDGAWIDGDSWAAEPDYSPQALQDFRQETGLLSVPRSVTDPAYKTFLEFNRRVFRRHIVKYIDAIHQFDPSFQITSNWAFSSLMPEPITVNVDYLSGDVAGQNCVNNAAFQARCLAPQGKPWDLMSWSFGYSQADGFLVPKTLVHLEQEAAEVTAVGGGFQSYWTQNRDGSLKTWNYDQMARLTEFCRNRQSFCQNTETVPQIALWYSVASWKKNFNRMYAGGTSSMEGVLTLLLDGQHTVDILMDHHLPAKLKRYKLLVIPEWVDLDSTLKVFVLNYVSNGGSLLVAGGNAVREFQPQLGVDFVGAPKETVVYIGYQDDLAGIKSTWQPVKLSSGTVPIGSCYSVCDSRYPTGNPVATISRYGKGMIGGFYLNVGSPYMNMQAPVFRKLMNDLVNRLFPDPTVRITGSEYVHTVMSRKGSKLFVHLINTGGSHSNRQVLTYNEVPPVGPLSVRIQTGTKPRSLFIQPEGKELSYTFDKGVLSVTVPRLEVHSIIEINE